MRKSQYIFSFCLISIFSFSFHSCTQDTEVFPLNAGYDYQPTFSGHFVEYDVDSVVYNDFTHATDTFRYRLKELIDSSFIDNAGRESFRILRYKKMYDALRSYDSLDWKLTDVWMLTRTSQALEKVEENIRFVRLVFPIEKNKKWNGNIYNMLGEWTYKYTLVDVERTVGGIVFDSVLVVQQMNEENLIEKKYYTETYARGVGMVSKQVIDVRSDNITAQPILQRITSGVQMTMTVHSYGN